MSENIEVVRWSSDLDLKGAKKGWATFRTKSWTYSVPWSDVLREAPEEPA